MYREQKPARLWSEAVESGMRFFDVVAVFLRFERQMAYKEIGSVLGVTRERARQRERRGIRVLRHPKRRALAQSLPERVQAAIFEGSNPAR